MALYRLNCRRDDGGQQYGMKAVRQEGLQVERGDRQ